MEPPRRAAPLLPARAPGTCGIAERAPAALWSRRRGGGLPRLVGNDLCLGLELTAHEFRCPSSLRLPPTRTAERLAETAGSALPLADSGGRSAARGAHARTARWKEPIPPTSALGLFASKSVRPDQKSVKNSFRKLRPRRLLRGRLAPPHKWGAPPHKWGGRGEFPKDSPSVVLCHSRNAATGDTIVRVAEAAGPPHVDSHPRAAKVQGGGAADLCNPS